MVGWGGVALVRIETPKSGGCSQVAPFEVNYLNFSQETTTLYRVKL
jgi:hypothetical protein